MTSATSPVRHFVPATTLRGRLHDLRYTIARRAAQAALLLLFYGTAHWGWTLAGRPLLDGNLSAAKLAGIVPLSDPFAMLQVLASRHALASEALAGAGIAFALWLLLGGRAFCAWACPFDAVADAAAWLRDRLGLADRPGIAPDTRHFVLAASLVLSAVAGVAAFEWVSPIGLLHRAIVFGTTTGLVVVAGVALFDLAVLRRGWCGHLCPLGAFWSLVGRAGVLKVRYDTATCTRCGDCVRACPEPRVIQFQRAGARGFIDGDGCTNCGRCIAVCPENSLALGPRPFAPAPHVLPPATGSSP
jgi:ferredoxin-type protein NapH